MINNENYTYRNILDKIEALKSQYNSLIKKSNEYCFSALCLKNNFYKNPSLNFNEEIMAESIVDGKNDGGVDILLTDPNSDTCDLAICQSKFHENITYDECAAAVNKMINFFRNMDQGSYELTNPTVQKRFTTLYSEVGEESKIIFVLYCSANKKKIQISRLEKILLDAFNDTNKFELRVYFGDDIISEIRESESRRKFIDKGELTLDLKDNALFFNEGQAAIVNISAFSLKELYVNHDISLLAQNLRYFIKRGDIDSSINQTISKCPESFWYKNNGITIICDKFEISGPILKLKNFSIVNGGQTTYLIWKSQVNKNKDFYLPCKVITAIGQNEEAKANFILEVAKATNSQKAIKPIDLKSNAPEQVRFSNSMRDVGIYYQTKRGEKIPKNYKEEYLNTDLMDVGKLCLAGVFQLPASSRSKPSTLFNDKFYNQIFNSNQKIYASIGKDLLYIDYYFRKIFLKKFDTDLANNSRNIAFVHNSRTICIAFVALGSRYLNGDISDKVLLEALKNIKKESFYDEYFYPILKKIDCWKGIFNKQLFKEKDKIDDVLYKLFDKLNYEGEKMFNNIKEENESLNETNYLKKDLNYFKIIKNNWLDFKKVFDENKEVFIEK